MATINAEQNPEAAEVSGGFLTTAELLQKIPVCRRTLSNWIAGGQIPYVKIPGSRKLLFHWGSVHEALLRLQRGTEIGVGR